MYVAVRADRLHDLDASLEARAGALSGSIEHDFGWEVDEAPSFVVGPLTGWRVRADDGVLLAGEGRLEGRVWSGRFAVETEGSPRSIDVSVAQDPGPVLREVSVLVGQLFAAGLLLGAITLGVAARLTTHIVDSDEFQRLRAAWVRQGAFTADASHELRTPLAVIRSQAEVGLRQERTGDQYRATLRAIAAAAVRMQDLIEGLLVLARSGEAIASEQVDLTALVSAAVADGATHRGTAVVVSAPATAPTLGDGRLLRVLVDNLLSNALRHTPEGTVTIRIDRDGPRWRIEVADDGEGIAPEHVARVFERFYRADAGRSRRDGGSGLGLAISRTIAEQHGGTVALTSAVGVGTRVTVRLPG